MADNKVKMSRERYEEISKELEYLQTVREKEVSELIKEARSYGDLSENSEYDEAKNEQGKLYSKIAELKSQLENAEIVEHTHRAGVVGIGSRVTVLDVEMNEQMECEIVNSTEANPMNGRISDDSPFGKGLIGHKVGETITVEAPAGELQFKILNVTFA